MPWQLVGDKDAIDSWRQLALEVIVALSESSPAMVRKFGGKFLDVLGRRNKLSDCSVVS